MHTDLGKKTSQTERRASAKDLSWKCACYVQETERRPGIQRARGRGTSSSSGEVRGQLLRVGLWCSSTPKPTQTSSGVLVVQWRHARSLKWAVEGKYTPQLANASNQGSHPWKPIVKHIPVYTTACRCGEKFALIGIGGHWRGFELGNNGCGFILKRSLWRADPRGARREAGKRIRKQCSGPG